MPHVITQSIRLTDTVTETMTFGNVAGVDVAAQSRPSYDYVTGTSLGTHIDLHYEHTFTLTTGTSTTLTLSALTDDLGRTVAFVKIKRLSVQITAKTGNDVLVLGAATSNPITTFTGGTTPTWTVRGYDLKVAQDTTGFAVASGSSDQLKIANTGAASITFVVSISGTSA